MKHFKKTKNKKYRHMIQGLLSIVDGLVRILSFGYVYSSFSVNYTLKKLYGSNFTITKTKES